MDSTVLPAWVCKRDGRLVPFEADRISQALFAAGEALGEPDAFLAHELTQGVLHFLGQEFAACDTPATSQIAEHVAKVVRELGQPALAQVFARENQRRVQEPPARTAPLPVGKASAPVALSVPFAATDSLQAVVRRCLREYSLQAVFSRDLTAAHQQGWLTLTGLEAPLSLAGGAVAAFTGMRGATAARRNSGEFRYEGSSHA